MSRRQLVPDSSQCEANHGNPSFSSSVWLQYFEENRRLRSPALIPNEIKLAERLHEPLIKSLQRFQLGESGDGRHLRKYARKLGDAEYMQCMDMFIKEEQSHSQVLASVILSMNGMLINFHWTDLLFVAFRRMLHLKTEIFILLVAEIIGRVFYQFVAEKAANEALEEVFSMIVLDEILHIEFNTEFLANQLKNYPWALKLTAHYIWCILFYSACFLFVFDHREVLRAMEISSGEFIETCSRIFHRAATRSLAMQVNASGIQARRT